MTPKTVLIVEDESVIRLALQDGLRNRGIHAISAATAEEAWRLLEHAPDLDVAVLDIWLGDGHENGFDFAQRLKERNENPPEFLIHSAYQNVDYFHVALKLGVAAYLAKASVSDIPRVEVVAAHVRALALRRALQSPRMSGRLQSIAVASRSSEEAIERFCREILAPEIAGALDQSVLLILRTNKSTTMLPEHSVAEMSSGALEQLEGGIHARLGDSIPLIVNSAAVVSSSVTDRQELQRAFLPIENAAFIRLGETRGARLSLGLMPGAESTAVVIEQVKLLDRFLRPAINQILPEIIDLFTALELTREREQRQTLMRATTDFCLSQGQLLTSLVWEAEKEAGDDQEWPSLTNLRIVADEMRDAGELLVHFGMSESERDEAEAVAVDMAAMIERIWERDIFARLRRRAPHALRLEGHCLAQERVERVERTVSQIMSWLARRLARPPGSIDEALPELIVRCVASGPGDPVRVIFEEHVSQRLPAPVRATLFAPFKADSLTRLAGDRTWQGRRLGLYLARTLAELGGGNLVEHSDELPGDSGHRFVLELPAAEESA